MALTSTALTTLAKAKNWLGLTDVTAVVPGLAVYHDQTGTPATATVSVSATQIILTSATGAQTQTRTFADATDDTLTELAAVILPANGWIVTLLYPGAAASTDLVEVAATSCLGLANKQTINIVDNYSLEQIIEGVSDEIETWLGRGILSQPYQEVVYLEPGEPLYEFALAQPQITAVERLQIDTMHGLTVTYTGASPRAVVEVTDAAVVTRTQTGITETATTSTFAANVTLTAMAATIDALTDWTASVPSGTDGNEPSEFLVRQGPQACRNRNVQLKSWQDYDGEWAPNYLAGTVRLDASVWPYSSRSSIACMRPSRIQVWYTAGYATVPYDVEQVALTMVADAYSSKGRDSKLTSESLEGYSYTYGGASAEQQAEWMGRLARYQRVLP